MRVLWITNAPIGQACEALGFPISQSGSWIDAAATELKQNTDINLGIATTAPISKPLEAEYMGVKYYCIAGGKARRGKRAKKGNIDKWKIVIDEFKPDLIRIWGTEFTTGLDVMETAPCPVEVRLQGVIKAIQKIPNGYLKFSEMQRKQSIAIKIIMLIKYTKNIRGFTKQLRFEKEMVEKADCLVADNEWALSMFCEERMQKNNCIERMILKQEFKGKQWDVSKCDKHTIFCTAGRTAYKGLHQLIKAVSIVQKKYPDVKLFVPGDMGIVEGNISKKVPYSWYIKRLIHQLGIQDKIHFVGKLTSEEMVHYILKSNLFVMPSSIENESSSLREAMMIGCPCISSNVGDVSEVIEDNKTGWLYRYEEYERLASYIITLFDDEKALAAIASSGKEKLENIYCMQ